MHHLKELFDNNREWARTVSEHSPDFFSRLAHQQAPQYLWIGCADSRVPANEIVGMLPGEIFVHRNVANVVVHSDLNCLSVIQFAVDVLKVRHIIVTGHYGCGGVRAAVRKEKRGLIDNWLRHVQDVHQKHLPALEGLQDETALLDRMCELNVIEQAVNVARTTIVQDAWERGQSLAIHGWVYRLEDGLLRDLNMGVSGPDEIAACYRTAVQGIVAA
ncbi:MAG: carbonate dehydratase [Gammaproteobacteria bacterium]